MEQKTLLKNKKNQGNGGETTAKRDDSVKKKVPELRFKGFTDDWEQRKLSTESTITAGGDIDKSKLKEFGEYPIFANALTNDGIVGYYDSYYRVEAPAVTVTGRGDVGYAKARKVNFTPVVRLLAVKSNHDVDFLENAINNHKVLVESTGVPQLTAPQLGNYKIFFPTGEEQEKIGSFFKQLDDTIALHQRKLDLLKEQKKGYLQKMFPKNGEKVPELRFAGFADDWEEHKVGNFLSESKIKGSDGSVSKKLTVKLWRKGIVPKEEIYKGSSATQYYIRLAGQFMYGKLDFLNQAFGILPNELDGYESTLDSPAFDFKDGINPNFFLEYVCRENFYKYQGNIANGSRKAKRIHADTFFDMPITIPNFEEQQKIGSFFKQLDDTIALHQRKLDLLKEQKKGFLQKMFV